MVSTVTVDTVSLAPFQELQTKLAESKTNLSTKEEKVKTKSEVCVLHT